MHLLVVHYHWRPGGVRQVVETTLHTLADDPGSGLKRVHLASGEPPPADWRHSLESALTPRLQIDWTTDPLLAYASEWPGGPADHRAALTTSATRLVRSLPAPRAVLVENPAVGRHPFIGRSIADACAATGTRLICRHHDFFFDGRWERWPEWTACGTRTFDAAIADAVPDGSHVVHLAVTERDANWLRKLRPAGFCPNTVVVRARPTAAEIDQARHWLRQATAGAPVIWLCPTRVLRRKNLAEALLLAALWAPSATVATTGAVSSPAEAAYARALTAGQTSGTRPLHAGLLARAERSSSVHPNITALMAASDQIVVPSLYEGFGLPVVEASSLGLACLARRDACPEARAPHGIGVYNEIVVPWKAAGDRHERARQQTAWLRWLALMPVEAAAALAEPAWWQPGEFVPFSRLTLDGQLAVLRAARDPAAVADWRTLNPLTRPAVPAPLATPRSAISPPLTTLADALAGRSFPPPREPAAPARHQLLSERLPWANQYPLLWPGDTNTTR
jgi:hypothetical protein